MSSGDEIQAMTPVYFSRVQQEGETEEDYNTSVSQNEMYLNENLKILYEAITEVRSGLASLRTSE